MQIFSLYNNGMRQKKDRSRGGTITLLSTIDSPLPPLFLDFVSSLSITDKIQSDFVAGPPTCSLYATKNDLLKMQIYMFWANKRKREKTASERSASECTLSTFKMDFLFDFWYLNFVWRDICAVYGAVMMMNEQIAHYVLSWNCCFVFLTIIRTCMKSQVIVNHVAWCLVLQYFDWRSNFCLNRKNDLDFMFRFFLLANNEVHHPQDKVNFFRFYWSECALRGTVANLSDTFT